MVKRNQSAGKWPYCKFILSNHDEDVSMKPPEVRCTTCTISAVGLTTLLLYIAVPPSARVVSTCNDRVPVQSNMLLRSRITDL